MLLAKVLQRYMAFPFPLPNKCTGDSVTSNSRAGSSHASCALCGVGRLRRRAAAGGSTRAWRGRHQHGHAMYAAPSCVQCCLAHAVCCAVMATVEAPLHENIKQALVNGDERSTTLIFRSLRNTGRHMIA